MTRASIVLKQLAVNWLQGIKWTMVFLASIAAAAGIVWLTFKWNPGGGLFK